ncbi:MAG TPA: type II toxin-antitoxin system HicA family toxin [Phycisphaerae bacterium]|nr:type II toxin-antitoxin system HicA family toxin [Phycisphaerae bacterium]
MSSRLPVISGRDLVRVLSKLGFQLDRQRGSHMMLFRPDPPMTISVPDHKELDRGTLRAILRQAGISPDDLQRLL